MFLQVTPVMWEINQQWICSVPKQFVCPPPIQLEPLAVAFNISSDFHSLGDGIYSKAQMEDYKRYLASGQGSKQLLSEMSDVVSGSKTTTFSILRLVNAESLGEFSTNIAHHLFGIFSDLSSFLAPFTTVYAIWSVFWLAVRNTLSIYKVYRQEGCKPLKFLMIVLDPIIYLMMLPVNMARDREDMGPEPQVPARKTEEDVALYPQIE